MTKGFESAAAPQINKSFSTKSAQIAGMLHLSECPIFKQWHSVKANLTLQLPSFGR